MSVRYAPSPTGRLHVGNLRTAWVSRELARRAGLPWVVRFEDIDVPRIVPGAREQQLEDLGALGLIPAQVVVQSERQERHWSLFCRGVATGAVYPCFCSRKALRGSLEAAASAPHGSEPVYPGRCRDLARLPEAHGLRGLGWRFRGLLADGSRDLIIARSQPVAERGEIPARESFAPSYNWACAIDDLDGGHSLLVRASDLADVAEPQRMIQRWVQASEPGGGRLPAVFHAALVVQDDQKRLEKRTRGVTLAELIEGGFALREIIEIFRRSFELVALPRSFALGEDYFEARRSLTLAELGLSAGRPHLL